MLLKSCVLLSLLIVGVANTGGKQNQLGAECTNDSIKKATELVGQQAPMFSTKDISGNIVTLKRLVHKISILVFIEKNCPCCSSGKEYIDRIEKFYGDETNILGIVVGSQQDAVAWYKKTKPKFTVVSDPNGAIARSYGAVFSLSFRVIDTNGKIILSYPGYSAPMLKELTSTIAKVSGVRDLEMPTSPAPAELTQGCALDYDL